MTTALTGETGTGQGDTHTGTGTSQTSTQTWRDGLPDSLKAHKALEGFDSVEKLAQTYVNVHDKTPPVPASPDAYKLEGVKAPDAVLKSYREMAHKAGMTEVQAKAVFDYWAGLASSQRQAAQTAAAETAKQAADEAETKLKAEWGANFETNLTKAKEALKRFGGDEFVKFLDESKLGNHPAMAKFLFEVRNVMSEDVFIPDTGSQTKPGPKRGAAGEPILTFPSMEKK